LLDLLVEIQQNKHHATQSFINHISPHKATTNSTQHCVAVVVILCG
jgi:hypothetical protein